VTTDVETKIDVTHDLLLMKRLLETDDSLACRRWPETLAILARWERDNMLTDESRRMAGKLLREFRGRPHQ
jgi:hypothetical protein